MPVQDIKVSLRGRNTDFETSGYRYLPITKPEYVLNLLGPDGKINPNLIPAWLWDGRSQVGIADLVDAIGGGTDIHNLFIDINGFNMSVAPLASSGAQGSYIEVTTAGQLKNISANAAKYELIGAGNAGVRTFPLELQSGDYIVLVKINSVNPLYSFAIVDNTYGDASTIAKGIVQLYSGIDSASNTLAATASAVKTAYDLASGKETAFAKNTAFNKNFTTSGGDNGDATTVARGNHKHDGLYSLLAHLHTGVYEPVFSKNTAFNKNFAGTGSATTVARSDHSHTTFDFSNANLGGNIIKEITVTDGIVTALTTQSLASIAVASGLALATDLDSYVLETDFSTWEGTNTTNINNVRALAKKGLEYYGTLALADAGGHANGDIVMVLEA